MKDWSTSVETIDSESYTYCSNDVESMESMPIYFPPSKKKAKSDVDGLVFLKNRYIYFLTIRDDKMVVISLTDTDQTSFPISCENYLSPVETNALILYKDHLLSLYHHKERFSTKYFPIMGDSHFVSATKTCGGFTKNRITLASICHRNTLEIIFGEDFSEGELFHLESSGVPLEHEKDEQTVRSFSINSSSYKRVVSVRTSYKIMDVLFASWILLDPDNPGGRERPYSAEEVNKLISVATVKVKTEKDLFMISFRLEPTLVSMRKLQARYNTKAVATVTLYPKHSIRLHEEERS